VYGEAKPDQSHIVVVHRAIRSQIMPSHGKNKTLVEGKYPLHAVLAAAEKILKKRTEGSIVLDPTAEAGFPKLRGRGAYCRSIKMAARVR
jgi:hypothetical protein